LAPASPFTIHHSLLFNLRNLRETIAKNIWMKNKIIYLCIPILSAYIKKHSNEKNISAIQQKEA
jgi:hypothetical protein